jgi:LuxR family maltose regulon positive regulatory protein
MTAAAVAFDRVDVFASRVTMPRARAQAIARPALDAALEAGLAEAKLVLLCAPAGYGKTTALVQQLSRPVSGRVHAWVTLSEDDNLPNLLACLLAALEPLDLPWRQSTDEWRSLVLSERGLPAIVTALATALAHAEARHGVIVLDDLHRLADERAHVFLNRLIEWLPERWTVAATSRNPPQLALARWRLGGDLVEFGEAHLRFDAPQVRSWLERQQFGDSADQLYESTQGWPVGVTSLARALRGLPAHGTHDIREWRRRMFAYLASEVLNELPPQMGRFLLRCSVLHELTAERCAKVARDARAASWLEELERRDLFVAALETEPLTLRLHDLFREFLEARLQRQHPDEYPALLLAAADTEQDFARRVTLQLRAGAVETALADVMESAADIVLLGREAELLRVIEQFPLDLRDTAPALQFARGVCAWHRYRWRSMAHSMLSALEGFERQGQASLALRARGFAVVALVSCARVDEALQLWAAAPRAAEDERSRVACLLADYNASLMNGPGEQTPARLWRLVDAMGTREGLRWICFQPANTASGRWGLHAPIEALARALAEAAGDDQPRLKIAARQIEGWGALSRLDLHLARDIKALIERELQWLGEPAGLNAALQFRAAFEMQIAGDGSAARDAMRAMTEAARKDPQRRAAVLFRHLEALFASGSGSWDEARSLREQLASAEPSWPVVPIALAVLDAELALARGDPSAAVQGLLPLLSRVADVDAVFTHTRLRVALARAYVGQARHDLSWQVIAPLLEELRRSREALPLLILGTSALDELAAAPWPRGCEPALVALLRATAERAHELRSVRPDAAMACEPPALSERERQVLDLIALGRSNKVIARELGLSPHTVKRHVARILERTGQASRSAAAHWYLAQGAATAPASAGPSPD